MVDDHELFREGVRALLERAGIAVVGAAGDARGGKLVLDKQPEAMAIIDVTLPGPSGLSLVRDLKRETQDRRVLVLSMHEHKDVVADALDCGADGYAFKRQSPADLVRAIRVVHTVGRYLPPGMEELAFDRNNYGGAREPRGALHALSRREYEIFDLLVRGSTNQEIAEGLFISPKTVETHRARIMHKLDVHNIGELVRLAVRVGHHAVAVGRP